MNSLYFSPKNKRLGDFDLICKDNKLYCIFIENLKSKMQAEAVTDNSYGLAYSYNGLFWKYDGTVKKPGAKSKWNSKSLWAMDVFRKEDKYYMLYSALGNIKGNSLSSQQVGLASSRDLKSWTDIKANPVITNNQTDKYYYPKKNHKFCWRDPEIFKIKNEYYSLIAAKDTNKPYESSGCVGLLNSKNLKNWQTLPPLFSPDKYWEIETPHIYKINNAYYLIFGEYVDGMSMRFATSSSLLGKYKEPRLNTFTPAMCYAGRIIKLKNKYYFYHWIRDKFTGKKDSYLSPPKIVETKNKTIFLKKYKELNKYFKIIPEKYIVSNIKKLKNRRGLIKKKTKASNIEIKIETKNKEYLRSVSITKTIQGLSIRDYDSNFQVNDLKTIPVKFNNLNLEIFIENKFLEIYINNYFIYAAIIEKDIKNIKKISFSI